VPPRRKERTKSSSRMGRERRRVSLFPVSNQYFVLGTVRGLATRKMTCWPWWDGGKEACAAGRPRAMFQSGHMCCDPDGARQMARPLPSRSKTMPGAANSNIKAAHDAARNPRTPRPQWRLADDRDCQAHRHPHLDCWRATIAGRCPETHWCSLRGLLVNRRVATHQSATSRLTGRLRRSSPVSGHLFFGSFGLGCPRPTISAGQAGPWPKAATPPQSKEIGWLPMAGWTL
jgi:hypothetical protein